MSFQRLVFLATQTETLSDPVVAGLWVTLAQVAPSVSLRHSSTACCAVCSGVKSCSQLHLFNAPVDCRVVEGHGGEQEWAIELEFGNDGSKQCAFDPMGLIFLKERSSPLLLICRDCVRKSPTATVPNATIDVSRMLINHIGLGGDLTELQEDLWYTEERLIALVSVVSQVRQVSSYCNRLVSKGQVIFVKHNVLQSMQNLAQIALNFKETVQWIPTMLPINFWPLALD